MTSVEIISSAIGASTLTSVVLVWLCQKWIAARLTQSIQHEYDAKLEKVKTDCQKILDENRITFSWWHEEQAKAIKDTYIAIAELCVAIASRINCVERNVQKCSCHKTIIEKHKQAQNVWECNKIFIEDHLHSQIDEILSISLDIKENALQARKSCGQKRQTELEYCHENREKIDLILSELRKELRIIMSGVKSK